MTDACRPHSRRIFHPAFSPARFAPKSASNVHWRRVLTSTNDIRRSYLDHFAREGHQIVPSAPLVTHHDPMLMFFNPGMVLFKNVFNWLEKRPYSTAPSSQKCLRPGRQPHDHDNDRITASRPPIFHTHAKS